MSAYVYILGSVAPLISPNSPSTLFLYIQVAVLVTRATEVEGSRAIEAPQSQAPEEEGERGAMGSAVVVGEGPVAMACRGERAQWTREI